MPQRSSGRATRTPLFHTLDLSEQLNWPRRVPPDDWWRGLASQVRGNYPTGLQRPWGIPFAMAPATGARVVITSKQRPEVVVPIGRRAGFLCLLHHWAQPPATIHPESPCEGLAVAEYELLYEGGNRHVQPVRARFEVAAAESPGPPWVAVPFEAFRAVDPAAPPAGMAWGRAQTGVLPTFPEWARPSCPLLVYAMPNPCPEQRILSLTIRGLQEAPLLVAGVTLFRGKAHPLRHLPRRTYRVKTPDAPASVARVEVDLGGVARVEHTSGPRDQAWLRSQERGPNLEGEKGDGGEDLVELYGAEDATVSVTLSDQRRAHRFPLGEAFRKGQSVRGEIALQVLGRRRQWMRVVILDGATGRPTPARVHFAGPRGEYLAPYGHHAQVNTGWFEDYSADLCVGGQSFAYVHGEFATELPVGDVYVEVCKGFEYEPVRARVRVKPRQEELALTINRWTDLRKHGWVTADTHVHFLSPQTAWLQAQGEGVNVVNLLASQWGRLFTSVGDYSGRVGVVEDDTVVSVGTENRHHMLGHMSMLGTQGPLPVFPMCCGGPNEAWVGDPEFVTMAEWALENRRKGGLVIRPHFPTLGHTEDPVAILQGLVDALEIRTWRGNDFPLQEWYRYLNCGYRVAVCGGTDKMSAGVAVGSMRTYARLDPERPFTYQAWAEAVRAGRTTSTTGPLIDLQVEGRGLGETLTLPASGGSLEVRAEAGCFAPLGLLELVVDGEVVAAAQANGAKRVTLSETVPITRTSWIAARCMGADGHPGSHLAAHTSPVYANVTGSPRPFQGAAAQHMLALVEGGLEYLNTLATVYDESSRKRMVKVFREARRELRARLAAEGEHAPHPGHCSHHTHG
jgi:hypothetical protein